MQWDGLTRKKQAEFTPEAVAAMERVLLERNLSQEASEQIEELKQAELISAEEIYNKFQRSEFGKVVSDALFAKENLNDSIYFQGYISPMHNYNWVNLLYILFGFLGLVFSIIFLAMEELYSQTESTLIIFLLFTVLLPLGIWKLSKNKAKLCLVKRMRSSLLVIKGAKDDFEIQVPFRYVCFC